MGEWQDISAAPKDTTILLAAYIVPSDTARENGSTAYWSIAMGRYLHEGCWSGVLSGKPTHWMPIESPSMGSGK